MLTNFVGCVVATLLLTNDKEVNIRAQCTAKHQLLRDPTEQHQPLSYCTGCTETAKDNNSFHCILLNNDTARVPPWFHLPEPAAQTTDARVHLPSAANHWACSCSGWPQTATPFAEGTVLRPCGTRTACPVPRRTGHTSRGVVSVRASWVGAVQHPGTAAHVTTTQQHHREHTCVHPQSLIRIVDTRQEKHCNGMSYYELHRSGVDGYNKHTDLTVILHTTGRHGSAVCCHRCYMAYLIGSDRVTSLNVLPPPCPAPPSLPPALESFAPCSLNCCISLSDKERPVPSYPLTVEHRNTRYGPSMAFTNGSGMAAASSMTNSSACANLA